MRGILGRAGVHACRAALVLATGLLPAHAASAPGVKVSQVDLTLQDQPVAQESRRAVYGSPLTMDRLGNLYRFEALGQPGSTTPQQYAVLVLDAHNHVSRRIILDLGTAAAASLSIDQVAVSPLGDAFAISYAVQGYFDISLTPAISAVQKFDATGQRVGAPYQVDLGSASALALSMNLAGEVGIATASVWNANLKPALCGAHVSPPVGCIVLARLSASGAVALAPKVVDTVAPAGVQGPGSVESNYNGRLSIALRDDGGFYLVMPYVDLGGVGGAVRFGQLLASYAANGNPISRKLERLASSDYTGDQIRLPDNFPSLSLDAAGHPLFAWFDGVAGYFDSVDHWLAAITVERWSNGVSGISITYPDLKTSGYINSGVAPGIGIAGDAYGRTVIGWLHVKGLGGTCTGLGLDTDTRAQRLAADGSRVGSPLDTTVAVPPDVYGPRCFDRPLMAADADGDFAVLTQLAPALPYELGDAQIISRYAGPEPVDLALSVRQSGFGQNANYRYTVKNTHAKAAPTGVKSVDSAVGAATGLTVTLNLGGGDYRGYSGSGWTCSSADGLAVRCEYAPPLAATATSGALMISAHIACRGTLQNTARAASNQYDPAASNDVKVSSKKAPAFGACN